MNNQLQLVEYQEQRILTTQQLADAYEAETQLIINNFNRNRDRYTEGKHYYALEGTVKTDFLNQHQIDLGSKHAKTLYLWTEKGAWLHAKSLNTDRAWTAYEMLVDEYYRLKEQAQVAPALPKTEFDFHFSITGHTVHDIDRAGQALAYLKKAHALLVNKPKRKASTLPAIPAKAFNEREYILEKIRALREEKQLPITVRNIQRNSSKELLTNADIKRLLAMFVAEGLAIENDGTYFFN